MPISEFIVEKAVDSGFLILKDIFKKKKIKIELNKSSLEDAIYHHSKMIDNITKTVSFKEMLSPKSLNKIYVDLNIYLSQRRLLPQDFKKTMLKIENVLSKNSHPIILGDPGAGKTTTLKNLTQKLLHEPSFLKFFNFPILIELRDFEDDDNLFRRLTKILGIEILLYSDQETIRKKELDEKDYAGSICEYIDSLKTLILIDGLDELNEEKQRAVIKELRILFNSLNTSKVLLTCRSGAFDSNLDNTIVYEICELNPLQISSFIKNWFSNIKLEQDFKNELLKDSFKDFALRPLTLSHLCALYEKHKRLPEKPKYIYKKLIFLLLEDWDIQREIVRTSIYHNFETDRKYEFLSSLAYQLTVETSKKRFTEDELLNVLLVFAPSFGLKSSELLSAINEIESHNGIFVKSSFNSYEFSHKSMQEYLAADFIIRNGSIPYNLLAAKELPNEIAIAISLSSHPNNYFFQIFYGIYFRTFPSTKIITELLKRLYIEKPDFANSAFLAFTLYYIFYLFYFNEDIYKQPLSIDQTKRTKEIELAESTYLGLFNSLLTIPGIANSFRLLYDKIIFTKEGNQDLLDFYTSFIEDEPEYKLPEVYSISFPITITISKRLFLTISRLESKE